MAWLLILSIRTNCCTSKLDLEYAIPIASYRLYCTSIRRLKSSQFLLQDCVHISSDNAAMRGIIIYSICFGVEMYSVHTVPSAPLIYFACSAVNCDGVGLYE